MKVIYVWGNSKRRWFWIREDAEVYDRMEKGGFIMRLPKEMEEKGDCAPDLWEVYNALINFTNDLMEAK